MGSLSGSVALVTGAGSGIGLAVARSLSKEGATVGLCGRSAERLEHARAHMACEAHVIQADVSDEESVDAAVRKLVEKEGRLDLLVNNAGVFNPRPLEGTSSELWDQTIDTNLKGAFLMSRAAWPHLKSSQGQVANVSSVAGTKGFVGSAAYCASKFGMNGLTEVLALEGRDAGVRVFAVCPGSVETPLWEAYSTEQERLRMMRPEDVAELLIWLVKSPRTLDFGPVVVTNFKSPFDLS